MVWGAKRLGYRWFVIHAYSGFERKVADKIEDDASRLGLSDQIDSVLVPMEEVIEMRRGEKVSAERKFFPGYILLKAEYPMSDECWHLVMDQPKVTGFLGSKGKPSPISETEANRIIHQVEEGIERPKPSITFDISFMLPIINFIFVSLI